MKNGRYTGQTVPLCHKAWLKSRWSKPQKEDDYQEYPELENLDGFRFEADIYMSKLDIQCQSKGYSGLATFYGTGFGTCGYNDKQ